MALTVSLGSLSDYRKKMKSTVTNRAASPVQIRRLRLAKSSIVCSLLCVVEPLSVINRGLSYPCFAVDCSDLRLCFRICVASRFEISPLIQRPTFTHPSSTVNPPPTSLSSPPLVDSKDDGVCLANHPRDFPNQIGCMVASVKSWPSSLNKVFSTSSVETKTPCLYASNHYSTSFKTLRVRFQLCPYSPLILLLDVYVNMLDLGLELCSYSPIILDLDVYDTSSLGLLLDCSRKYRPFSYSTYNPTIRSLLPCPPWLNPNHILLRLGLEVFITDDLLYVPFKGSTLFSAAELEIVKSVLDAVTIKDGSSLVVFITSTGIIPILPLNVIEIRGLLHDDVCLCIMNPSILCLCDFRCLFVATNVAVLSAFKLLIIVVIRFNV